jgi:uncharacterized SAM-binding protein YcdF (DUF218 family)
VRTGILVLGYHRDDGAPGIAPLALACVRRAERLASDVTVAVVVCSGFAREGGEPEGRLMRDAWDGPPVEVVAETHARDTVDNAALSLPLLRERGIERVVVVCAASHAPRVRLLLPGFFARHGMSTRVVPVWRPFPLRRVVWEVKALRWVPSFRRRLAGD